MDWEARFVFTLFKPFSAALCLTGDSTRWFLNQSNDSSWISIDSVVDACSIYIFTLFIYAYICSYATYNMCKWYAYFPSHYHSRCLGFGGDEQYITLNSPVFVGEKQMRVSWGLLICKYLHSQKDSAIDGPWWKIGRLCRRWLFTQKSLSDCIASPSRS